MQNLALTWGREEHTLRSGGAKGADSAFEQGALASGGPLEIFYTDKVRIGYADIHYDPDSKSNISSYDPDMLQQAMEIAKEHHPNWGACSSYARKLHARNSFIILGACLNNPVDEVVCWTPGGKLKGGTAQGLRIAKNYDVNVSNLGLYHYGFND
jgi:hypothetical protein